MSERSSDDQAAARNDATATIHPRIAGGLYIFYFLSAAPLALRSSMIRLSDPALTATHILASEHLYRATIVSDLASYAAYIALTVLLAQIGALVSRTWAIIAALLSLTGCIVLVVVTTLLTVPLGASAQVHEAALSGPQLQQISTIALRLYSQGFNESLFLFGAFCVIMGVLFAAGRLLPFLLSLLLAIAGAAWITLSAANIVMPTIGTAFAPYVLPLGAAAEILLGLWLLVRGVNLEHVAREA
jgi:hypothetical protein